MSITRKHTCEHMSKVVINDGVVYTFARMGDVAQQLDKP